AVTGTGQRCLEQRGEESGAATFDRDGDAGDAGGRDLSSAEPAVEVAFDDRSREHSVVVGDHGAPPGPVDRMDRGGARRWFLLAEGLGPQLERLIAVVAVQGTDAQSHPPSLPDGCLRISRAGSV